MRPDYPKTNSAFPWRLTGTNVYGRTDASTSSGMRITFVNESNKTATLVNFAVSDNGNNFVIRDVGTFSPGISIDHNYSNGAGQSYILPSFITPRVQCRVASVKYADGSIWRRGQLTAPAQPGVTNATLAATPRRLTIDTDVQSALFLVQSSSPVAGFREHDSCNGIASVYVASTSDTAVTYAVRPIAAGSCEATVSDEGGASTTIPVTVQ